MFAHDSCHQKAPGDWKIENGWFFTTKTGLYGTDYIQRALIAYVGLYANLAQDSIFPVSNGPDVELKYSGANNYVIHFSKGEMPPVKGFWSLTMYDPQYFFVDNPSTATNWVRARSSRLTATARWTSTSSTTRPARPRSPIGSPLPPIGSSSYYVCIGRKTLRHRSSTTLGKSRLSRR